MLKLSLGLSLLLVLIVLTSGCINVDPEALVRANPIISQFLREHPNADIRVTHYSAAEAEGIIGTIRSDCSKETIEAKEFYLVNITDQGFTAIAWVDWNEQVIECAYKTGSGQEPQCIKHFKIACHGDHVYWFDSCGNKEDKKEYCNYGCLNNVCIGGGNETECKSKAKYACYGDHIYWFDSCGHVQEKKEYCEHGCENGFCKQNEEGCTDSDGGKDYYKKGVAESGGQRLEDHCNNDGTLTEKYCYNGEIAAISYQCPYGCLDAACKQGADNCTSHSYVQCYNGHVYWFNSCKNVEEKNEYCNYGCEGNACKTASCTNHSYYACYNGHLYWYNSCQQPEEMKQSCLNGCDSNACITNQTCSSHTFYACFNGSIYWFNSCQQVEDLKQACTYGCESNACKPTPAQNATCTDSDGGQNYFVLGNVTTTGQNPLTVYDYCNPEDGRLVERFCEGVQASYAFYTCQYGCENGACKQSTTPFCMDADVNSSNSYYVKSTCTDDNGTYTDYCEGSTSRDYYCGGTWNGTVWLTRFCAPGGFVCPNGCTDGACLGQ